ncbi:helix-turn-helix domain-containing protein [Alteribacter populi]|uniref:helix-turn-helix domain-containing protein n=1 Tax=Alteribacter populi TaxID=2011011 RepID=UPI001FE06489|nr:helix-turn-helix transcriptional regulator [Alteribacter populi]
MGIGSVLRMARKRKGISQEELADKLHCSMSAISKMENDKLKVDVPTFIQWAKHTNAQDIMIATLIGIDPVVIQKVIEVISPFIS